MIAIKELKEGIFIFAISSGILAIVNIIILSMLIFIITLVSFTIACIFLVLLIKEENKLIEKGIKI